MVSFKMFHVQHIKAESNQFEIKDLEGKKF
jgi:hypothetical protein